VYITLVLLLRTNILFIHCGIRKISEILKKLMSNHYHEKLNKALMGKTCIFIDAANLERSVQDMWVSPKDIPDNLKKYKADELCWRVDYGKFKNYFNGICDLKNIRFYSADFATENHFNFLWFLKKHLRFNLVTKLLKKYNDHTDEVPHRKANFDVELAVDAVHNLANYKTFVLFSGDCDFEYLLKYMRGQGRISIVFSRMGHVAKELPPAANYYFDIVDFRNEILRVDLKRAKNPAVKRDSAIDVS
jgi:uncharacterized LabA/DUF88 family protein